MISIVQTNERYTIMFSSYSHAELVTLLTQTMIDPSFNIKSRQYQNLFVQLLPINSVFILIDLANMHGANHAFSMQGVDIRIKNTLDHFNARQGDFIRYGGDEIIAILPPESDFYTFIARFDTELCNNDLYALYTVVIASESFDETFSRADALLSAKKLEIEQLGLKPSRNDAYLCMESILIVE